MRFVAEYRDFADKYRQLSQKLTRPKDKKALDLMARAWDKLAIAREQRLVSPCVPVDVGGCAQTAGLHPCKHAHLIDFQGPSDGCAARAAREAACSAAS
jgi:alkylhydroperoxidase/carboxymuconolactone decarboxylase family protein YurZ